MGFWQVVGIISAIGAGQAGVWTLVALRMKTQRRRLEEEVAAAGEEFVIPPCAGCTREAVTSYRQRPAASWRSHPHASDSSPRSGRR